MLFQVAMFLHRELPIRLAHRVRDLDSIPHLSTFKGTKDVRAMYAKSFEEIRAAPTPNTPSRERYFAELLQVRVGCSSCRATCSGREAKHDK